MYASLKFIPFFYDFILTMLEYCKTILTKVSFDKTLFEKELSKSITYLMSEEVTDLYSWARLNFEEYKEVIIKCFES